MKKYLLLLLTCLAFTAQAQVDNYALRFTSAEGVVNLGTIPTLKSTMQYTLQMWVCPERWEQGAALMRCGTFSLKLGREHSLVVNDGTQHFSATNSALAANVWTHLTLRCSTDETKLYVNNTLVRTFPGRISFPCEDKSIWLGGGYQGRIDEVRVWRGILPEAYQSYWRTTLNKFNPSWTSLQAYWKMDQEQCPNLVDYKGSHHGTLSPTGVEKQLVTDNHRFKYLINLAYGNIERYFDRSIDAPHYWLSNRVSIIGATVNTSTGHASLYLDRDDATLSPGAVYLAEEGTRKGLLHLTTPEATLSIPKHIIDGHEHYTVQAWVFLDKWAEGAYIFRKETADGTKGISLRLGTEQNKDLILRLNGTDYTYAAALQVGKWFHVGFSPNAYATKPTQRLTFALNGTGKTANADTAPATLQSTTLQSTGTAATVGEGLCGKIDELMIFAEDHDASRIASDRSSLPLPGADKSMAVSQYYQMRCLYSFDREDCPGFDQFSVQGFFHKMRSYTEGMRGVKFTLTVAANNFDACLADASKRASLAADIAAMGNDECFDGVDLDFEWTYSAQGWRNIGLLCQAIRGKLGKGKILSVSPHKVAYAFPTDLMKYVDYFNFQCYGPGDRDLCSESGFTNAANLFIKHGYPKEKIILSYSTTTTSGYRGNTRDQSVAPAGYRYIYPEGSYDPSQNFIHSAEKDVDYWVAGWDQVVWRGQYCVEQDLGGIMYWDLGNDLPADHKHSMARGATYTLASNVEALVTSVRTAAPAPADDATPPTNTPDPDDQGTELHEPQQISSLAEVSPQMAYTISNTNGLGTIYRSETTSSLWLGSSSNANFATPADLQSLNSQWLLIEHASLWYLYNIGAQKFVEVAKFNVTSQPSRLVDDPLPLEVTCTGGAFTFRTYTSEERGFMCASPQLANNPVCQWTADDQGSTWHLTTAPDTDAAPYLADALKRIDPTLLRSLSTPERPAAAYDLTGRRLKAAPHPGLLYISGGHKIIQR